MNVGLSALLGRTFAALRVRNYRLYFASQIVSFSGNWMQSIALAWLVLQLTGSGAALGTVLAMQFLPTLLLAPYGGLIADRFEKRKLIIGTQSVAGVLALVLGIITLTGVVELWMVYVLAAGFGSVTALDNPSRQTFVMEMVGPAGVSNAVTLNSVVINAARAIGPAVGGVIIATWGVGECFIFNAISYLAVIVAMCFIRPGELFAASRSVRAPGQLREGFRYVRETPVLRTTLLMLAVIGMLTYEFPTTLPMMSDFAFQSGASGLALMTTVMGIGAVVGGLIVAASPPPSPRRLTTVAPAFGAAVLLAAAMPTIELFCLMMPLVGALSVATIATSNSTLQLNSEPHLRGRVMSLFSMALLGSTPIGGPLVGWIGDHAGP
ncbi:MAG: MFS transporter, partial [Acidimicrobiaceae bacterium]|nr:MFS transporter [Acidimicrobiaceae bacterium]